jgi:hypothetical protein
MVGLFKRDGNVAFAAVLYPVLAVYALMVAAIVLRAFPRRWAIVTDGALLMLSMILMSPITSASHFIALILCYAVVVAVWLRNAEGMRAIAAAFMAVLLIVELLTSSDLVGNVVKVWAYEHRVSGFGMLSLLAFFAIYVWRRLRREASAGTPDQRRGGEVVPDHAENAAGEAR